ncbi:MAG: ABC transporter substrate-binding protein, partial [Thermomicrobium sp.]|nr:ABC transporter substrate-binding protein [Thermomicrobium sp.]
MDRTFTRRSFLAFATTLATACAGRRRFDGESQPGAAPSSPTPGTEAVTVALDWYPWSNHTGLLLARERGHFRAEALDVRLEVPANPEDVLKLVATGRNTFGM